MRNLWFVQAAGLLLATVTFLNFQSVESTATYELQVRAHRYSNSESTVSDGSSCDGLLGGECENRFKFCMREYGVNNDGDQNNCPLGSFTTGEVGYDNFSFGTHQIDDGVPNPMIFPHNDDHTWEGGFQLLVVVYDEDPLNSDDHVDNVYIESYLSPGGSIPESEYVGESGNSHITLSFSLSCTTNYYDSAYNTHCVPRDDSGGHYTCHATTGARICRSGWSNPRNYCRTPVCASNCNSEGGYCLTPGQCLCHSGWSGSGCSECQPSPGCSAVGGYCNVPEECICRENYFGAHCEIGMLCTNDQQGGYICHCPAGSSDVECENECNPNPCLYGSTCASLQNGFKCVCPSGSREECDSEHDYCYPYPCQNGGTCIDGLGGYECECGVGWTGDRCQVNIDECVSASCQNGGTCIDGLGGYECECGVGWTGDRCQVNIDECVSAPCQNGGTCFDLIGSYNCLCTSGFSGPNCQLFNECLSSPCLNGGVCQDLVLRYSCNCEDGFDGLNCEFNRFPCRDNPCQNGGTCIVIASSYSCVCPPDYTGSHCLVTVEASQVEDNSPQTDGAVRHVYWAVPVLILLVIVVTALVVISLYCHHKRKRQHMLPHPDMPAGNETVTVATKGKEQNLYMIPGVESSVYTRTNDSVYESTDTYGNMLQDNIPSTTAADYCIPGAH